MGNKFTIIREKLYKRFNVFLGFGKGQSRKAAILLGAVLRVPLPTMPPRKKERKMVTTPVINAQRVACTKGYVEGPAMWGDNAP